MKSNRGKTMIFTRVRLANWRNFAHVEVALQRRVFLVGPNASGKSNFLDVFRFLHDLAAVGGGFQEAVVKRGGVSKLRCLAARRRPEIEIDVTVGGVAEEPEWRYELTFNQDKGSRPKIEHERVEKNGEEIVRRPDRSDKSDPERLRQTHLEQVNVNREFRELTDFFALVRYLHLVPQLVRDRDRYMARGRDPFGSDFLEQVARSPAKTRNARLRRISNALKVAVPQLQELEFYRDATKGTPHLRARYEHWRPQGAWQTEQEFSDGTLRLLGLLWAVLDGSGPLLLEEPEMSLHPEIVRVLPAMFARIQRKTGRQVLVSTHSSDLLYDTGIGLDEVILLNPAKEGTEVRLAKSISQAKALLQAGVPLADAVLPYASPPRPQQLALFDV